MSGGYTIERQSGRHWNVLRPDGAPVVGVETEIAADLIRRELNSLAARSGSPEGWPEGAELATLGTLDATWQVYFGGGRWVDGEECIVPFAQFDASLPLVARRKPKPVTRDVRAWDIEPGMKLADGREVWAAKRNRGQAVYVEITHGVGEHFMADDTLAVLVEDSDG